MSKPYHGERRCCRLCQKAVTFLRDEKGVLQCLDSLAPVYAVERDLTGDERVKIIEAHVLHTVTCSRLYVPLEKKNGQP